MNFGGNAVTIFSHAVASFDPTANSVLLWTRITGATSADWMVATDPEFAGVVVRGTAATGPESDFTVVVDAGGLQPATSYWYRFEAASERSPVGRTRTLPAGEVSSFSLGLVSCARFSVAPLTVYRAMGQAEVDLVVHLGDYIYDDAGDKGPRSHDPPGELMQLEDYRKRLAQIRGDRDCQALHMRHPMAFVWDDHDFADNAWLGGAKEHDPDKHGEWSRRRDAAVQAHREWLPWRQADPAEPLCIYRSAPIGDLAELILLDSRIIGRDCQASFPGSKPIDDPTRSLLGDPQREWLKRRLADESHPWALVANGVAVNPIPMKLPFARLTRPLLPEGYVAVDDQQVLRDDQWDGYPAERSRLVEFLALRAAAGGRTVLLAGDVHSSWAFEGPDGPDGKPVAVEVTVPSVSSAPMGRTRMPGVWRLLDRAARKMEHVRWAEVTARGFAVVRVGCDEVRVAWWFVDPYDTGDVPETHLGAAFRTRLKTWPPRWEEAEPPEALPGRIGMPELPPRPDDVRYVRLWHLGKRMGLLALLGGAGVSVVAGLERLVRFLRDRR